MRSDETNMKILFLLMYLQGDIYVNERRLEKTLIDMVIETQKFTNANNVIKFNDNSSAIQGFSHLSVLAPQNSTETSLFEVRKGETRHIIFTAETHNFPTGVAPFQGATTGERHLSCFLFFCLIWILSSNSHFCHSWKWSFEDDLFYGDMWW